MKLQKFLVALAAIALVSPAFAAASDPDEMYLQAFALIQKADLFAQKNSVDDAIKTYESADSILTSLHTLYPTYNSKLVEYRERGVSTTVENLKLPPEQRKEVKPLASQQPPKA